MELVMSRAMSNKRKHIVPSHRGLVGMKKEKGIGRQQERERSVRVWKKETAEQSRLDMISMECLLTLIHGLGPTDKWLNSSAVKARGFLWACVSLCTSSWREGSSQLTDTELTMKHTKRSPSSTSAALRKAEGLYDRDWSGYTTPTQTAHMNAVLGEPNRHIQYIYVINLYFKHPDLTARL